MKLIAVGALLASGAVGVACSTSDTGNSLGPDTSTVPDTITVNGKVVDGELYPIASVPVWVTGHAVVTTDANGRFSVTGVERPYAVATALSFLSTAVVYTKLTRDDPTLMISVTNLVTPQSHFGTLQGTVSGGTGYPQPDYHRTQVLFESPELTYSALVDYATGNYNMASIDWRGPNATTGTIHALQWRFDSISSRPAEYLGYGEQTGVEVRGGGGVTRQDVQVTSPVAALSISGTVTVSSGYTILSRTLAAGFGPTPTAPPVWTIVGDNTSSGDFQYIAPDLPGAALTLQVSAKATSAFAPRATATRTVTSDNASALSITVPPAPDPVSPPDSATGVTVGATLVWRGMSTAVYVVTIVENVPTFRPRLNLITSDTTVVIPDFSALGFPFGAGRSYIWYVSSSGPFASLDDAAGSTGFFVSGDRTSGFSVERHFTTPP